jgi:hypothetical protein
VAEVKPEDFVSQYAEMARARCKGGPGHMGPTVLQVYCRGCIVALCAAAYEAGREDGRAEAPGAAAGVQQGPQKPGETRMVTQDGKSVSVGYRLVPDVQKPPREKLAPKIEAAMKK